MEKVLPQGKNPPFCFHMCFQSKEDNADVPSTTNRKNHDPTVRGA